MPNFCKQVFEATKNEHLKAESCFLMQKYIKKSISLGEHINYLRQQFHIFSTLEKVLENHPEIKDDLRQFFLSLTRKDVIKQDYDFLCGLCNVPANIEFVTEASKKLQREIEAAATDLTKLLAFTYIQYRALFNGGITIKSRVQYLLGDQAAIGAGVGFYCFGAYKMFELDKEFVRQIELLENVLDLNIFIETAKKSYDLNEKSFQALEPVQGATTKFFSNAYGFWNQHKETIVPVAATAGLAVASAVAISFSFSRQ